MSLGSQSESFGSLADSQAAIGDSARSNPWMPARLVNAGIGAWAVANLITALAYFSLGFVVNTFFSSYGLFPAPIWLPTAVATVAGMVGGLRMLPGIFLGSALVNGVLFHASLQVTTIISLTNALGPITGATLLLRLRPERGLFTSFPGVIAFIVCTTILSPAISAAGGTLSMALGQPLDWTEVYSRWVNWWLTDSGGALYLAPALILWMQLERELTDRPKKLAFHFDRRDLMVWAWVAAFSVILFLTPPLRGSYIRTAFPFLLVVPLSWIALRMSLRFAYSLVTLVSIAATAGTVAGFGPFQNHGMANPLQLVGVLVVLLAMNVLTIVALVSERADAQNASRVKSMFLANTSHELRTPLNAIIGFSSLIAIRAGKGAAVQEVIEYAETITSSGEHLLALINDLLDMSRIEAGRVDMHEETIALPEVVEDLLDLVRFQANAKSIRLAFAAGPFAISVKADRKALRQILLNLLSNALKFTRAGGLVEVAAAIGSSGELRLSVKDNGVGIPAEALQRVFRPFERAHQSGAADVEGTGLGLSIAQGLAVLHGGSIELESTVGEGTVATVILPANRVVTAQDVSAAVLKSTGQTQNQTIH